MHLLSPARVRPAPPLAEGGSPARQRGEVLQRHAHGVQRRRMAAGAEGMKDTGELLCQPARGFSCVAQNVLPTRVRAVPSTRSCKRPAFAAAI